VSVAVGRAAPSAPPSASEPAEFRHDLPQGYDRGYVVDGVPIRESYRVDTSCTTATATVGGLTVQVQSLLIAPDGLEFWVKKVDLKALASAGTAGATEKDERKLVAAFPAPPSGWQIVPPTTGPPLPGAVAYQVYEQGLF